MRTTTLRLICANCKGCIAQDDMPRPYFVFLDELRESGEINMFGAPSYLRSTFGLTKIEALNATSAWMKTFGDGTKNVDERVALAEAARPS